MFVDCKARVSNKVGSSLHSRYAVARKVAAATLQKFKMQSWEHSGMNRIPITGSQQSILANYPVPPWAGKKWNIARSFKDQNVVSLRYKEDTFCRWREYFKDLSNPVTVTTSDTQLVLVRGENAITAPEVILAVKTSKSAGCDQIRRELSLFGENWSFQFEKRNSEERKLRKTTEHYLYGCKYAKERHFFLNTSWNLFYS